MITLIKNNLTQWWRGLQSYGGQLMFGIEYKAIPITLLAIFTDTLGGSLVVLSGYVFFACCNLLMGVTTSVVFKEFSTDKVGMWMWKIATQITVLTLVAFFFHMFFSTSGVSVFIVNWFLLMYASVDLLSIVDKMQRMGMPVPPVVLVVLKYTRKKVAKDISNLLDDPDVCEEIEKALSKRVKHPTKERRKTVCAQKL